MPGNMLATPERTAGRYGDGTPYLMTIATEGGEMQRRTTEGMGAAADNPERMLNRFIQSVAFGEWVGNAFGALAFLWATGVLLGGFCGDLNRLDFWFATTMIFIEAFRIYSRHYRVDHQSLFGTTKALRWISSPFSRKLWRPQEGDELALFMGLWINLVHQLPVDGFVRFPHVALLVFMSRLPRLFQAWVLLIAYPVVAVYHCYVLVGISMGILTEDFWKEQLYFAIRMGFYFCGDIVAFVAVLLLKLGSRRIVNLTSSPLGCKLLSFTKGILAICLACDLLWNIIQNSDDFRSKVSVVSYFCVTLLTEVVLLLGSLQCPRNSGMFGHWIDAILRICFLLNLAFPLDSIFNALIPKKNLPRPISCGLLCFTFVALMLIGNLQIPAAIAQVLLSSVRLHKLKTQHGDYKLPHKSENMVPAIEVFYTLALCQGSLYIMACILGAFSVFPRRSLVRQSKFCGQQGAKAVDLYYHRAYETCMVTGLLAARKTTSLGSFAKESLFSSRSSDEMQLAGLLLLDNLLSNETDASEELKSRIISSNEALSMLIGMLGWSGVRDKDIRLFAARVTARLAGSIRIDGIPSTVKLVSSLLDVGNLNRLENQQASLLDHEQATAENATSAGLIHGQNVMANQQPGEEPSAQATSNTGRRSWRGQWMKEKKGWSILEDPILTYQDSLPVLGMIILEELACDPDNCAEMLKASDFIPKIIGLISSSGNEESNRYDQQNAMICSSLYLVRRLASTGGKIGATVRQKLWESPFLLDNLAGIFEDCHGSPEIWMPAMDIIANLALDEEARQGIGSNQVIIGRILHVFLGRDGPHDQSLRMAAGEALVNLSMESAANCSAILEEPGYGLVKDLKDLLCEAEYKVYISMAANLLQNLCAHSREKLMSHPGATEHLRSALPAVMEKIVSAEGKQLEALIGLASQIYRNLECFIFELESQTNQTGGLVKKLVDTLKSNRKPSPDYPRMRRVINEMVISLVTTYPIYRTRFRDEGMMEALSHTARTPSKVEKYRVFRGDEGVVVESGKPLRELVDRAKGLIGTAIPTPALN